jgi:hypothetical protein
MALFDALIAPTIQAVASVISQFHLSPEDKLKADEAIAKATADAKAQSQDYEVQLNSIAGQNIRADAASGDGYTSRARPSFMYVIIAVFAWNYIGISIAQMFGSKILPIVLPGDLLTLFGVCVTGYVFNRTAEKVAALPGDSQVSILGLNLKNKS